MSYKELPHIFIAIWSGDIYENLINDEYFLQASKYIDLLRDGRFVPKLKNLNQFLQGSTNQRYVDVQESLKQNKVIEFDWR